MSRYPCFGCMWRGISSSLLYPVNHTCNLFPVRSVSFVPTMPDSTSKCLPVLSSLLWPIFSDIRLQWTFGYFYICSYSESFEYLSYTGEKAYFWFCIPKPKDNFFIFFAARVQAYDPDPASQMQSRESGIEKCEADGVMWNLFLIKVAELVQSWAFMGVNSIGLSLASLDPKMRGVDSVPSGSLACGFGCCYGLHSHQALLGIL